MKAESSSRLLSLDVFRGITIAFMILVNSPGNETAYWPLDHSEWNGLTPTDLVFPFFIFIAGVSLVFSLRKRLERGDAKSTLLIQVVKRTALIFGLGLFLNAFPFTPDHLASLRILGVLQRIALCYFFSAVFFLYTNLALQILAVLILLIGYAWVMLHVAAPGFSVGDLTKEGNLAAYIDRMYLAGHMYRPVYDPEGLLSTLPAVATGLLGNLTGCWLRSAWTPAQKLTGMLQAGLIFLLAGTKWSVWFPINKALWTSSFVLVTAGWALLLLSLCYGLIEIQGYRRWGRFFEIFGVNAIAAYVLHVFFLKVQNLWHHPRMDGSPGNIRIFLAEHFFGTWTTAQNASLGYALGYTLFWFCILWILYRLKSLLKFRPFGGPGYFLVFRPIVYSANDCYSFECSRGPSSDSSHSC
jgi:predicted acyltransferase